MSEVIKNKYLDLEGLKKYDELIKAFIESGDVALAESIQALGDKIGSLDFGDSDDATITSIITDIREEIDGIIGDVDSLEDGEVVKTLVEISNKLKELDSSVGKNAQDISGVDTRLTALEGAVEDLGKIEGGENLATIVTKVNTNVGEIEILKGDGEGSVKKTAADAAATALEDAKEYADGLVKDAEGNVKFDAAGAAAQALADAKADAAGLYQVKGDYESAGAAAQALTDAKAYVDAFAHASEVKYEDGYIKLYDDKGNVIGKGFDASPFVVDGMLDNVEFVKDENGDTTTTLRFTFNVVEGSENEKKTIDVDFGKYVDIYQADGTSLELTDKTFSIKEVAATKTKTVEAIPVAGGPLESLLKGAGINEIAAGTSIEDVLFSLICKELWASELTFSEGTVASSIAQPTFTLTKDGDNVSGTVEIGTKVVLSDITMGAAIPSISKNRTYSGFTYGYSAENDNTQDSDSTSITAGVDKAAALNEGNYTMSRDYTGFNGAADDSATANTDASEVSLSGAELVVGDGTNKVKVTVGGPTASATFAAMPVYYACSNLKKTKDAVKDSEGQYKSEEKSANTVTSNNASNYKELSVTGKRYMFWGAHAEHKTLDSAIIREHANGGTISTQAKTVTITIPESGVNQFYVALPSGRTLTKVYNTAAGEQFGEVTDSFTSSTIAVEGAEGYTSANYTVWIFNSGTAWVGPNTLTVIIG